MQTFTAAIFLILFSTCATQQLFAQFTDNFSDGDFTQSPEWRGTTSKFAVSANVLRLQAPAVSGDAYLSTPSLAIEDASWEFTVGFDFNPSSTNYARVYLVSDQADLASALNGYFVAIGAGSDDVSLYRQQGSNIVKIIDGTDARLDLALVTVHVWVTRDALGTWTLKTAVGGNGNIVVEGTAHDENILASEYFGVSCVYTSTRSDKFAFDDFVVTGHTFTDRIAPTLTRVEVKNDRNIALTFSEALDNASATTLANYSLEPAKVNPTTVQLQNSNTVHLSFNEPFANGVTLQLSVDGVKDLPGNTMAHALHSFTYIQPVTATFKDIVITEIFADPTPTVGLPDTEYVELLNRSQKIFLLTGWTFSDGSSTATLGNIQLQPGEYLILTSSASAYGGVNAVEVVNFPSLNNASDRLILRDDTGVAIDSLSYSSNWYADDDKREGGWSLELIDPDNTCASSTNWTASEDVRGGTPGKQNSVFASKPDVTGPVVLSAVPENSRTLVIVFNEALAKVLPNVASFNIDNALHVTRVSFADPALTAIALELNADLRAGTRYTLTLHGVFDCAGNAIAEGSNPVAFGLPEAADSLDVLVNEVLFNPKPTGVDFVEIVNTSGKYLNIKNWSVANVEDGAVKNIRPLTTRNYLLPPGAYLVLTEDADVVLGEYPQGREENFFVADALPSMPDDEGSIALVDDTGRVIDFLHYNKSLHSVFLRDPEGVSLERVAFATPSNEPGNWKSAAQAAGFATPGYINSNALPSSALATDAVTITPEVFHPLLGQPDFTQIHFNFDHGGYIANIKIFDPQGRVIKSIANNALLGTSGFFTWEGDQDNGTKARVGSYMLWFEVFDAQGTVKTFRERVVVAARF